MKKILILIGVVLALGLTSILVSAHTNCSEEHSHAKYTCEMCGGKACPNATKSGVCNCTVFYKCPNDKCSMIVCSGCYYKYVLPNLNKGCPKCKGHNQYKQVH